MAELITLARPYAKAAFEQACEKGNLEQWSASLALLVALVSEPKVEALLLSPAFTAHQKSDELIELCGDLSESVQNFVRILAENKRLPVLPLVRDVFESLKAEYEKTLDVQIVSAFKLTTTTEQLLAKSLSTRLSCEVNVITSVDKSLIGGAIIHAGDTVIDGSVRGRLEKLSEAMNA